MTVVRRYSHSTGKSYAPDEAPPRPDNRADFPTPMIQSDVMDLTFNHADKNVYDSKSRYEKAVHENGGYIMSADEKPGNPRDPYKAEGVGQSIKDAIDQIDARL